MADKIESAKWVGTLTIGDMSLPCSVLEDGTRVLTESDFMAGMGMYRSGALSTRREKNEVGAQTPLYLAFKNLIPYINKHLGDVHQLVLKYKTTGGLIAHGIRADLIPKICDVWLDAQEDGVLGPRQEMVAKKAKLLMRALAHVGIIALVDEATGYQNDREKDALQVILSAYISEELQKWQKMFPDQFYYEIFRLNGWNYNINGVQRRPGVIGTWTNELIYKQLPDNVLEELKSKTPKSESGNYTARLFQSLTPDIGHPALSAQIYKVIGIMNISNNWAEFKINFNKMTDRATQSEINFDAIEKNIKESEKKKDLRQAELF